MIGAITKPTQFLGPWFLACVMLSDDGVALSYALVADVCVTADQDAHLGSCLTTEPAIISLIAWCRLLAFGAAFAPPQVRRSHKWDLISVWKGDRSEHTTLRATARRCLDPFHDPRPAPRQALTSVLANCFPDVGSDVESH